MKLNLNIESEGDKEDEQQTTCSVSKNRLSLSTLDSPFRTRQVCEKAVRVQMNEREKQNDDSNDGKDRNDDFFFASRNLPNIFYRAVASTWRARERQTLFFLGRVYKRQGSSPNFGIERTRSCLNSTLIVPDLYVYDVENLFKNVANIPENYRINKRYAMNERWK